MSWPTRKLKDISSISYGYTAKASFELNGPKFLRITDIQDGRVDWDKVPSCELSEADYLKHKLIVNDIVFARTGATTGKSFLIKKCENAVAASYLIRVRITSEELLPEFLAFFFHSEKYWNAVSSGTSGSTQGGFNASKLGELNIPIPPKDEQLNIVNKLDLCSEYVQNLESIYLEKIKNLDDLKKSILKKAFSGEITTSKGNAV